MFVTFEGPEGSGKTTLIQALADRLRIAGKTVLVTREPGAGEFGTQVRRLLLESGDITTLAELFLFLADRAEHIEKVVKPALKRGEIVLCDRHADSTVVYQGYARGGDIEQLRMLNSVATQNLKPDLTFLLDVSVEVGLARQTHADRIGAEATAFHEKVRQGYLSEAKLEPERFLVINAGMPAQDVLEQAWNALNGKGALGR
jgi:dTMP kinase